MSLRRAWLSLALRVLVRPNLATTMTPARARLSFRRVARFFRVPPYLLHLERDGGPPLHWFSVGRAACDGVILYFHGGAYVAGGPETHAGLAGRLAKLSALPVVAPQYRLAPEHPAPAAFEDARAAHAALLGKGYAPGQIILAGDSAGGGLALALLADLCQRGLRPAGLVAMSPWTDLGLTGASLVSNAATDSLLPARRMAEAAAMVLDGLTPEDPRLSPLYAGFVAPPPVLIQVGTGEILLDDSRRMAVHLRAAGGAVSLSEWPDCPHVWQIFDGYLPEARAALTELAAFIRALSPSPPPPADS